MKRLWHMEELTGVRTDLLATGTVPKILYKGYSFKFKEGNSDDIQSVWSQVLHSSRTVENNCNYFGKMHNYK